MAENLVSKFTVNSQGTDIDVKIKDTDARNLIAQEISDRSELIKKNESGDTVIETNNKIIETAHDKEENIADTYSRQVNGNSTVNVGGNATEVYNKTFGRTVTGDSNINVSGAATEVYAKTFEVGVTGASNFNFTGGASVKGGKINITNDIIGNNLKLTGDITYKTPTKYNDYFDKVTMLDNNGDSYDLLVATPNIGKIGDNCDIRNYGGKGDGTTNDTKAFNDCMLANNVVYLPTGKGLNWVLDSITITDDQSVIGDGNTKITYSGSDDLFLITGSRVAFYGLNISCTNHGNAFHIKNASATSYFYLTDIVVTGATHLWYDTDCVEKYTHLYVHNMTGHNMAGTAIDIRKGFAFLFLDNVTGANLPAHASWPTFIFVGTEGLHMTHCEAEGGGVDGSKSGAYGFLFQRCQAVWLERCMADLCESDGFRMDGDQNAYFYFNNCVSSLCFGNGFLLNGHHIFMNGCFIGGRKGFDKSIPGANGLYVFGSDILVSTTNVFNMTGIGIVLASGQRNNIGTCEVSTCNAAIFIAAGCTGIIHDIYIVDNVSNIVQDGSSGTVKYYYVYNGTMLSNVT